MFPNQPQPLHFPKTSNLQMTGERYVPGVRGYIRLEHYHRYLFAATYCMGKEILDIACGEGYGSYLLSQVASRVFGVDVDQQTITGAIRSYGGPNLSFAFGSANSLPYEIHRFDVAVSFETIEHIVEHDQFVSELKRVLKPDGLLVISTPDRVSYNATLSEPNKYHLCELTRIDFEALLRRHFKQVNILDQMSFCGSIMSGPGTSGLDYITSDDSTTFKYSSVSNAPFLVALASDTPVVSPSLSIMHNKGEMDELRADLGYAESEMWRLQEEVPTLRQRCAELEAQVAQNASELRELSLSAKLSKAETQYLRERLNSLEKS